MKKTSTFAPANISCIFVIKKGKTPQTTGSTGVGFTINEGVTVEVLESKKTEIFFNGEKIDFPTVSSVIKFVTQKKLRVNIASKLPLGCGFGLSGASALATANAIDDLLNLKKTKLELAKVAHIAEVENGTGLGDVTNQYFKGFLLKTEPSFKFKSQNLNINSPVYCKVFSKLETKTIVSGSDIEKINNAGEKAIAEIESRIKTIKFEQIIQISKRFALESGLLKDENVIKTIREIEQMGGNASMIMLGNAVFADIPFEGSSKYEIL